MLYLILIVGLITAYINGMHDGGTIVATTITSRIMTPRKAIVISGLANLVGALFLGTTVALTVSQGMVDTPKILAGGQLDACLFVIASFVGSIVWNILTWITKMPSSASHSMLGAMVGCAIIGYGSSTVGWNVFMIKVVLAMVISPIIGFVAGYLFFMLQNKVLSNATMVWDKRVRALDIITSILLSISHGSNDAQKVIGLLAIGLAACSGQGISIPFWLIAISGLALSIGTMTGGYNMIGSIGKDIVKIDIDKAFASQLSSIFVVELANITGLPISSTQVITGSVMGVGTEDTPRSVNWGITKKIVTAWIFTIPASAVTGAVIFKLLTLVIV